MNFTIIFHFWAILSSLIFDFKYWPLRLLGQKFMILTDLNFLVPKAFYISQHVPPEFLSRSTNAFCSGPTLILYICHHAHTKQRPSHLQAAHYSKFWILLELEFIILLLYYVIQLGSDWPHENRYALGQQPFGYHLMHHRNSILWGASGKAFSADLKHAICFSRAV